MYFMAGGNVLLLLCIQSKEYISICEVTELEHRTALIRDYEQEADVQNHLEIKNKLTNQPL